jgi:hypothetical protein
MLKMMKKKIIDIYDLNMDVYTDSGESSCFKLYFCVFYHFFTLLVTGTKNLLLVMKINISFRED